MNRLRAALAFAATLFVVVVSDAQPQPKGRTTPSPSPLAAVLLPALDDPNIVDELKLSDEQLKKLVDRRQEVWDEEYITKPKFASTGEKRNEATDALFKKTLTAEQYKRAVQLGAQHVLTERRLRTADPNDPPRFALTRVNVSTFKRYPELVTAFKLTDEQKASLNPKKGEKFGGRTLVLTMTPEQVTAAKEFLGQVYTKVWTEKPDPRLASRPTTPRGFSLLGVLDVRSELKLTEDQTKEVTALRTKWQQLSSIGLSKGFKKDVPDASPKELHDQAMKLKVESEKYLTTLKPEQIARLKQIAFQEEHPDPHIEAIYTNSTLVKELAISDEQVKQLDAVWAAFQKDATKVFQSATTFTPTARKIKELVALRRKNAEAVLTPDQSAKLTGMVGDEYTGNLRRDGPLGSGSFGSEVMRTPSFGKYTTEFSLLAGNKSIQSELKLTEEQIKKADEIRSELTTNFRLPIPGTDADALIKVYADRSEAIEPALGKLLTPEQAKRFREIMLQAHDRGEVNQNAVTRPIRSAITYPGVAETVKLTDEQKKKLLAGSPPAKVLTDDQRKAIAGMLGEPFEGDFYTPPFTTRPPGFPERSTIPKPTPIGQLYLADKTSVETALKLTPEQIKMIAPAWEKFLPAMRSVPPFASGASPNIIQRLTDAIEAFDKATMEVLTPEQKSRLAELAVQFDVAASLIATLKAPEMVKTLDLKPDQLAKLTFLNSDALRLQELLIRERISDPEKKLALLLRDAADERMLAVLTDTQKTKWKELTGSPWTGLKKTIPNPPDRGPRPGGFGGTGGFGSGEPDTDREDS